jgi:hypothetical protein
VRVAVARLGSSNTRTGGISTSTIRVERVTSVAEG